MIIANTKEDKNTVNKTGLQNFVSHLLLGNEHMFLVYFRLNSSTTFISQMSKTKKFLFLKNGSEISQHLIRKP